MQYDANIADINKLTVYSQYYLIMLEKRDRLYVQHLLLIIENITFK